MDISAQNTMIVAKELMEGQNVMMEDALKALLIVIALNLLEGLNA
jgi:hypothetical protein